MNITTLTVAGMTCGHCVAAVKDEVSKLDGVDLIDVDLASGAVTVHSSGPIDPAELAAAVDEAGYEVANVNTGSKLAAFGVGVVAIFGGAMAVGAAVGPIDVGGSDAHSVEATTAVIQSDMPRGLAVAADGFRLVVDSDSVPTDSASPFTFRIVDDTGSPVTDFDELHERPLHLIVVGRNLVDYWHLHPTLDDIGVWTVDLPALPPGSYRVFADFQPAGGADITLGTDVTVPGLVTSVGLPEPSPSDDVDGYTVELSGDPQIGEAELTFSVALDGESVRTEPYLGAAGHLVAIRGGDMAFLHVHPHDDDASDAVTFTGEFPTAGTFRLFLDFSHDGEVRTAAFTVVVPDAATTHGDPPVTPPSHVEGH